VSMARDGPPTSTVSSGYSTSAVNVVRGMETANVRHDDASDIIPLQVIADDDCTTRLSWYIRPFSTHRFSPVYHARMDCARGGRRAAGLRSPTAAWLSTRSLCPMICHRRALPEGGRACQRRGRCLADRPAPHTRMYVPH